VTATGATVQRGRLLIGAEIGHYWIFDGKIFDLSGYGKFVDNVVQNFSDITVSQGVQSITFQGIGESQYGCDAGASASLSPWPNTARHTQTTTAKFRKCDAIASGHGGCGVEVVGAGPARYRSPGRGAARSVERRGRDPACGPRLSSAPRRFMRRACAASGERRPIDLRPVDPDDAAFFDRERQPAVFQCQSGFAEQFAAPASAARRRRRGRRRRSGRDRRQVAMTLLATA
jgi:hypothetical protein